MDFEAGGGGRVVLLRGIGGVLFKGGSGFVILVVVGWCIWGFGMGVLMGLLFW